MDEERGAIVRVSHEVGTEQNLQNKSIVIKN